MNRKEAGELIQAGNKDRVIGKTPNGNILSFARVNMEDVEWIEGLSNDELLSNAISNSLMIEHSFSIRDLQMDTLYSMELFERGLLDKAQNMLEEVKNGNRK